MEDTAKTEKDEIKSKKIRILILSILTFTFAILAVFSFIYFEDEEIPKESVEISFIEDQKDIIETSLIKTEFKQQKDNFIDTAIKTNEVYLEEIDSQTKIEFQSDFKNHFIIVVGTFGEKSNAIGLFNELIEAGKYDCKIIHNGYSLYWVSVFLTEDHSEAKLFMRNNKINGWIKRL